MPRLSNSSGMSAVRLPNTSRFWRLCCALRAPMACRVNWYWLKTIFNLIYGHSHHAHPASDRTGSLRGRGHLAQLGGQVPDVHVPIGRDRRKEENGGKDHHANTFKHATPICRYIYKQNQKLSPRHSLTHQVIT